MAIRQQLVKTLAKREANIAAFRNELELFLSKVARGVLREIKPSDSTLEIISKLGGLREAIIKAGLEDKLKGVVGIYSDELDSIAKLFETSTKRKIVYSQLDSDIVDQLVNFEIDKTRGAIYQYADELKATIVRSSLTGQAPDLNQLEQSINDPTLNSLETELNTSTSGFNQAINNKKAIDAGLELFLYVGPEDDKVIRPFCRDLFDKDPPIYTLDEIQAMDNNQGLDVFNYRGGYNCRHQWAALDAETAKAMGYGN